MKFDPSTAVLVEENTTPKFDPTIAKLVEEDTTPKFDPTNAKLVEETKLEPALAPVAAVAVTTPESAPAPVVEETKPAPVATAPAPTSEFAPEFYYDPMTGAPIGNVSSATPQRQPKLPGSVMAGVNENLPPAQAPQFDPQVKTLYDAASQQERLKLAQADIRFAEVAKYYQDIDSKNQQYLATNPSRVADPYMADDRLEYRVRDYVQQGMSPEVALNTAKQDALEGRSSHVSTTGEVKEAPEDYLLKRGYALDPKAPGYETALKLAQRTALKSMYGLAQAGGGQQKFLAEAILGVDPSDTNKTLDYISKNTQALGDPTSKPLALVENAVSSIIQQAPGLLTGTSAAALTSMFLNQFGQMYDDSRRQKLGIGESTIRAAAFGAFEVLGEKLGLGNTLKGIKAAAKGVPDKELSSYFVKALLKDIPGEQFTYAGEFFTDKVFQLNPEAGLKAFIDGAVDTLAATVVQGGIMIGGAAAINKANQTYSDAAGTRRAETAAETAKQNALQKAQDMFKFMPKEKGETPEQQTVTTPPEQTEEVKPLSDQDVIWLDQTAPEQPAPPAQPVAKPVNYIDTETGEIVPSDQADPKVKYINQETGEVVPPVRIEPTMGKTATPEIEQQIQTEAARYAREYNLPLDLATDVVRGQHARGDLDVERAPAESVTGRIEPSISVSEQGAATTEGVAPSDTTGLARPVEDTESPVGREEAEPAALGEIPTLTERPPAVETPTEPTPDVAAPFAELPKAEKDTVMGEAKNLYQSREITLPIEKSWDNLPEWKHELFAERLYNGGVDFANDPDQVYKARQEIADLETNPATPVATPVEQAQTKLAEAEAAVAEAVTPEEKKEAVQQRNVARQDLKKVQAAEPAVEVSRTPEQIQQRIRQIQYDRRKSKSENSTDVPNDVELNRLKKQLKDLKKPAVTETPAAETPVVKPKRGRRKIERTVEAQAIYDAGRAAKQKQANQAADKVTSLINLLSKNVDTTTPAKRKDAIDQLNKFATGPETRTKDRSGKRAKAFLAQSDKVTAKERADLANRLSLEKAQIPKPLAAYAQTTSAPVKAFYKFTRATQALNHIMRNGTPFERALAVRLKPFLDDVRLVIADNNTHPNIAKMLTDTDKGTSASGAYSSRVFGADVRCMIVLRGENFGNDPSRQGVNNIIFLHEALHAATEAKIAEYRKLIEEGKPVPIKLEEMMLELQRTMDVAKAEYEKLKASGAPISPSVRHAFETVGIANFPEEFVAYGLTNPDIQEFLFKAPGELRQDRAIGFWKNLFSRFVNTIRAAFDMDSKHQSALQDLMLITEGIMQQQEAAPAGTAGVQLAGKNLNAKITKADKDTEKVQQSHDLNGGVKLFKDAGNIRTFENYKTLLEDNWDSMAVNVKLSILGALPTSNIIDWKGDQVPALRRIDELVQRASGLRQNLLAGYARKADALGRFISREGEDGTNKLAEAMHLARLSSVSPTLYIDRTDALTNDPRVVRFNKLLTDPRTNPDELNAIKDKLDERIKSIDATFKAYDALKPIKGAQDMYKMVRQFYKDANALTRTLLDQNIDKMQLEGDVNDPSTPKGKLMLAVRRMYEDSEFKGVEEYFPFMRHGDQRLDVAGPDGKETYFFDTKSERKDAKRKRARQLGVSPDDGNIFTVLDESHADSKNVAAKESRMLTEMFRIIEDATAKPGVNKDDLKDQLYQVYLSTLPEASYRKQFMHAENVTGFTQDIFRNFQVSATRIANQATKLRYGQEVDNEIQAAKDTLKGMPPNMQEELRGFVNEVAVRAREEFDPRPQSRVANGLTQFAYYWLLSGAASAAIQTTSLPIFVMSHLNPEYGYGKSAAKLARWMNVYNSMSFTTDTYEGEKTLTAPTVQESTLFDKNPILQRAFDEALARNVTSQLSGTPYSDSNRTPTNARNSIPRVALRETANLMSGLFTGAERLTREVTYMMTFELEYEKSGDFDKAVQKAVDMVHNQLGRFDSFDKPRLLRNGVGKIALQFKPYAGVVTKILVKGFMAAATPGQRSQGLQILSGILLTGAMLHGVTGMPLYTVICDIIDAVLDDLEDDEKRKRRIARYKQVFGEDSISDDWGIEHVRDKEARISRDPWTATNSDMRFRYEFLPSFTGGLSYTTDSGRKIDLAQMLEKGPISVATDMNIGSRTSFNDIWFKDPREGKDFEEQVTNTLEAFTPPSISAAFNVIKGISGMVKGETRKGIEQASPAAVANPLKAERIAREGVTTKDNKLILGKSELSNANIVAQVTGLTSTRAAALEEQKYKFEGERAKAIKQKQSILEDIKKSFLNDSIPLKEQQEAQQKAINRFVQFDKRYPVMKIAIDAKSVIESVKNAYKDRGVQSRGMSLDDKVMPLMRAMRERLVPGQPK